MSANIQPIFTLTPQVGMARIAGANTARDGSTPGGETAAATIFTAGANGSRVDSVTFMSAQTTAAASSAMVGRVFISDTGGTNLRLLSEVAIATATASNTAIGAVNTITFPGGLIVPSGTLLKATISVYASAADQMDVVARGGNY